MSKPRLTPSTKCRNCGKIVRVLPCGGDWLNEISPVSHNKSNGERCMGSYHAVEDADIVWPTNYKVVNKPAERITEPEPPATEPPPPKPPVSASPHWPWCAICRKKVDSLVEVDTDGSLPGRWTTYEATCHGKHMRFSIPPESSESFETFMVY